MSLSKVFTMPVQAGSKVVGTVSETLLISNKDQLAIDFFKKLQEDNTASETHATELSQKAKKRFYKTSVLWFGSITTLTLTTLLLSPFAFPGLAIAGAGTLVYSGGQVLFLKGYLAKVFLLSKILKEVPSTTQRPTDLNEEEAGPLNSPAETEVKSETESSEEESDSEGISEGETTDTDATSNNTLHPSNTVIHASHNEEQATTIHMVAEDVLLSELSDDCEDTATDAKNTTSFKSEPPLTPFENEEPIHTFSTHDDVISNGSVSFDRMLSDQMSEYSTTTYDPNLQNDNFSDDAATENNEVAKEANTDFVAPLTEKSSPTTSRIFGEEQKRVTDETYSNGLKQVSSLKVKVALGAVGLACSDLEDLINSLPTSAKTKVRKIQQKAVEALDGTSILDQLYYICDTETTLKNFCTLHYERHFLIRRKMQKDFLDAYVGRRNDSDFSEKFNALKRVNPSAEKLENSVFIVSYDPKDSEKCEQLKVNPKTKHTNTIYLSSKDNLEVKLRSFYIKNSRKKKLQNSIFILVDKNDFANKTDPLQVAQDALTSYTKGFTIVSNIPNVYTFSNFLPTLFTEDQFKRLTDAKKKPTIINKKKQKSSSSKKESKKEAVKETKKSNPQTTSKNAVEAQ